MSKKTIFKVLRSIYVYAFAFIFVFSSGLSIAYGYELPGGLNSTDEVTIGIYDSTAQGIVESDVFEFGDYFLAGLSAGIYNRFYAGTYSDVTVTTIYTYLSDYITNNPTSMLAKIKDLSLDGWFINGTCQGFAGSTSRYDLYSICLFGIRTPFGSVSPTLDYTESSSQPYTYTWTFKPGNGSSYFYIDKNSSLNGIFSFSPQLVAVEDSNVNTVNWNFYNSGSSWTASNVVSISNFDNFVLDSNSRSFVCEFMIQVKASSSLFALDDFNQQFNAYEFNNSWTIGSPTSSFSFVNQLKMSGNGGTRGAMYIDSVLFSVFPFYESSGHITQQSNDYFYNFLPSDVDFSISELTPYYLSAYGEITPPYTSPTPPIQWVTPTPYPTAAIPTPDVPGGSYDWYTPIGDLMTLVTSHYDFSISGYTFSISPFYTFMACLIMGLLARAFFGGSHE